MAWMWENVGARKRSWTVGWRDHEGKKQQETFATKTEARRFKTLKEADRVRGLREPSRLLFADWWDRFIVEVELRPKTRAGYQRYAERCILRFFGDRELGAIRKATVAEWLQWVKKVTDSAHTIRESFVVLRSVLSYAVELELLDSNPCQGMAKRLPDLPAPKQRPTLRPKEVVALSEAVDTRYRLLILTMGILGLRPSEAIGLQLGDVDLKAGTLTIQRSVVNAEGKMVEGLTKTAKLKKVKPMPLGFMLGEFETHVKQMGTLDKNVRLFKPRYSKTGYIHTDVLRGIVRTGGEKIGMEGLTSKVLRASAATNALMFGNIKFAAQLLRHANESMTLKHYIELTDQMQEDSWDAYRQAYGY